MEFIDVLFPINLGPLTYRCPLHLIDRAIPGMLVSAPLKKKITKGLILGRSTCPATNEIKDIIEIHGESPLIGEPLLQLLDWMADYYLASKGLVLKNMLPGEAFIRVKPRKGSSRQKIHPDISLLDVDEKILSGIKASISEKEYRTFLIHAPTSSHELSCLMKIVEWHKGVIILVPEIAHINHIVPVIRELAGERLCILHGRLSKGRRSEAIEKILSGEGNIVLGTRSAIFAPLKSVSMIAVMHEHNSSYKQEDGLRYNGRDIAVMRGYLEKSTVVLSSICPSIESFYNAKRGKYTLIRPDISVKRPRIKIVDLRHEKRLGPNLSKTVIDASAACIKKDERAMFLINRRGYSMLQCRDCSHIETCQKCNIPLIFHKEDKSLRCHYCGSISTVSDICRRCSSFSIELIGGGTQRIEEDIKKLLGIEPVRLDSDKIRKKVELEGIHEMIRAEAIIIGTKLLTKRIFETGEFAMAAVLNTDMNLHLPDFRSTEKTYHELLSVSEKIRSDGKLFIQTWMPQNYLFRFIKNYDYSGFCDEELARRKKMSYPPYSKLAIITFKGRDYDDEKVRGVVKRMADLEILGPSLSFSKKGQKEYTLLLKTPSKKKLHSAVMEFLKMFEGYKDLKVSVAIDP